MERSTWGQRARSILKADRPWFIFYGLAIIGLVGWNVREERRDFREELRPYITGVFKNTLSRFMQDNRYKLWEIQHNVQMYCSWELGKLVRRAEAGMERMDRFQEACFPDTLSWDPETFRIRQMVDSLREFPVRNAGSGFFTEVPPLTGSAAFWARSRPVDQQLLLSTMLLQVAWKASPFLDSCLTKTATQKPAFDRYYPVMSPYQGAVRPGERFAAGIFLKHYTANLDSMEIWVNGKSLPVKNGIAHFSAHYFRPGIHRLKTKILVPNRHYRTIQNFEKELQVEVLPSCLEH
jgi:hypothetical protein